MTQFSEEEKYKQLVISRISANFWNLRFLSILQALYLIFIKDSTLAPKINARVPNLNFVWLKQVPGLREVHCNQVDNTKLKITPELTLL